MKKEMNSKLNLDITCIYHQFGHVFQVYIDKV